MRLSAKIIASVSILLLLCSGLYSQPAIEFDTLVYDYGTIKRNSDGKSYFVFTNKGNAPLVITRVAASCGCTVPSYPRTPVMPGKTDTIEVLYNTRTRGEFAKTINIYTNAPASPMIVLTVKGVVER